MHDFIWNVLSDKTTVQLIAECGAVALLLCVIGVLKGTCIHLGKKVLAYWTVIWLSAWWHALFFGWMTTFDPLPYINIASIAIFGYEIKNLLDQTKRITGNNLAGVRRVLDRIDKSNNK
jgi:hypothetical protein